MYREGLQEWYVLRNLVLKTSRKEELDLSLLDDIGQEELRTLIKQYIDSGREDFLDAAARVVARLKPQVSIETAEKHPWLVLEKS